MEIISALSQDMYSVKAAFQGASSEFLDEIEKYYKNCLVCIDGGEICGVALHRALNGEKTAGISLFVSENHRKKGIGTALFKELTSAMIDVGVADIVAVAIEVDGADSIWAFLEKIGCKYRFTSNCMEYDGGVICQDEGQILTYTPGEYDEYYEVKSTAFIDLRTQNDLEPFKYDYDEQEKKQMDENPLSFYLMKENGEVIATGSCIDGEIDDISVKKEHRGRGLARKMVAYGVNMAYNRGLDKCHLWALSKNEGAIKLYLSMGFVKTVSERYYTMEVKR